MSSNNSPSHAIADALLVAVLLAALCWGVDVRIIFGVYLGLEIIAHLCKALVSFIQPVIEALRRATN